MARPITVGEYKKIISLMNKGFKYKDDKGITREFRPNLRASLILQLQASLGLRIGDVLKLKLKNFAGGKMYIREEKTGKVQYRDVSSAVLDDVYKYVIENEIGEDDELFKVTARAVQKQLKIVTDYLDLDDVGTHSFRKMFAMEVYKKSGKDIEIVKEMLNHTSVATTERYLRVCQEDLDVISRNINFMVG